MTERDLIRQGFKRDAPWTGAGHLLSFRLDSTGNIENYNKWLTGFNVRSNPVPHHLHVEWAIGVDNGQTSLVLKVP
jgi:hypothetical protein